MTDVFPPVVIPYARFLEARNRRRGFAGESIEGDRPRPADADIDAEVVSEPAAPAPALPQGPNIKTMLNIITGPSRA